MPYPRPDGCNVKLYPLEPEPDWAEPSWLDVTPMPQDTMPVSYETDLQFWRARYDIVAGPSHRPPTGHGSRRTLAAGPG
jgi:hypothetical protein